MNTYGVPYIIVPSPQLYNALKWYDIIIFTVGQATGGISKPC